MTPLWFTMTSISQGRYTDRVCRRLEVGAPLQFSETPCIPAECFEVSIWESFLVVIPFGYGQLEIISLLSGLFCRIFQAFLHGLITNLRNFQESSRKSWKIGFLKLQDLRASRT